MISENLNIVLQKIEEAAVRTGRNGRDIVLVCVTKTAKLPQIEEAILNGVTDIGESYIRDAVLKFKSIGGKVRWHAIGHIQTNKAKDAVRIFNLIHSVDSLKLAEEISKRAGALGIVRDALIEVKTSEEATKYGAAPLKVPELIERIAALPNIKIKGLMTMAPFVDIPEKTRPYFKRLKELFEELSSRKLKNVDMRYLSMGMTQDFEIAIEEGSNMVRIGRAIFGE